MFPLIPIAPDPTAIDLGFIKIGWYGIGYVVGARRDAVGQPVRGGTARHRPLPHLERPVDRRGAGAARRPALPRHRRVGPLQGQPALDRPAPVFGPRPVRRRGRRRARASSSTRAGKGCHCGSAWTPSYPGRSSRRASRAGATSSTRSCTGHRPMLPWGIAIDCAHRVAQYPCSQFPFETTGFHPLFFYESALNILGGFIALWLSRRFLRRLQPGDMAAFWGIWYGTVRSVLETFRDGWNWTSRPNTDRPAGGHHPGPDRRRRGSSTTTDRAAGRLPIPSRSNHPARRPIHSLTTSLTTTSLTTTTRKSSTMNSKEPRRMSPKEGRPPTRTRLRAVSVRRQVCLPSDVGARGPQMRCHAALEVRHSSPRIELPEAPSPCTTRSNTAAWPDAH